jgi:uncharacterized protein YjbI with pentapeptide repeats
MPATRFPARAGYRERLRADCARCAGLCCVAPAFARSADFAIEKDAGRPCPNLGTDSRCDIHDRLRPSGFAGCAVYDCFGAGQQVVQVAFGGQHWRDSPDVAARMFAAFPVVRALHELLWYLNEALALAAARPLHAALARARDETERLAGGSADALAAVDVGAHRQQVNELLRRASERARAGARSRRAPDLRGTELVGKDLRGADLVGRDLRGADLRGADLRGAVLLGADLRGADLRLADLTGADLRGADLRGATLTTALFVTQAQLDAAMGDDRTALPPSLTRPSHWPPPARPARG